MSKKRMAALLDRLMYAKHNYGHATESPSTSWDLGVLKAIHDLGASGSEHTHYVEGYIKTVMEYDEMMRQPDPEKYVKEVEKKET